MHIIKRLAEVESEGRHWMYNESRVRERMNTNFILSIYLAATFAKFVCPSYHLLSLGLCFCYLFPLEFLARYLC